VDGRVEASAVSRQRRLTTFQLLVIVPTMVSLTVVSLANTGAFNYKLILWAAAVALVELLPLQAWKGVELSMSFTLLIAVGFLYDPVAAGVTAFIASLDPREFRREVGVIRSLFNRSQVALSVMAASAVFHSAFSIGAPGYPPQSPVPWLLFGAMLAAVADYLVNVSLVALAVSISYQVRPLEAIRRMQIGNPIEFLVSYLGLGVLGVVLAEIYLKVGFWSVAIFLAPVVIARQLFFRTMALEEAHEKLKQREVVLEQLSNRMAEERQDERAQIAAYLHDDLAQLLFRLSLQVDIAKRHLGNGSEEEVVKDLELIRDTKNRTNELVRALIRDLHRSPLGRAGLGEALKSFTQDVGGTSGVKFDIEVADLPLPPPIALLMYHISREAVMNALKHSRASNINISLDPHDDVVELRIADDGVGFDADGPGPEGHFGLTMMRDRAQVAGGTFKIESKPGEGTTITATFAQSWLHEESQEPEGHAATPGSLTEPPRTREIKPGLVPPSETAELPGQAVHA
jgi:signal transduction histidine kinase